jgi:hypothetical protein
MNMDTSIFVKYIPLVIPLILIQLGLAIYALVDLARRAQTHGPRWLWAVGLSVTVLAFPGGVIVSGLYLAWGRNVEV